MNLKEIEITKFPNISGENGFKITFDEMIDEMINPTKELKDRIERVNKYKEEGLEDLKNKLKSMSPHYSPMGLYRGGKRDSKHFIEKSYTYIAPIDIDNIPIDKMDVIFNKLKYIPSIFFIIKSASGQGYKAFLKVKENSYIPKLHQRTLKEIIYPLIEEHVEFPLDVNQSSYTQPFYYTTDTKFYLKEDITPLDIDFTLPNKPIISKLKDKDKDKNFSYIPDILFEHYSIAVLSACNEAKNKKEYYDKYKKLYPIKNPKGSLIKHLTNLETFTKFVRCLKYDYPGNFIPKETVDEFKKENTPYIPEVVYKNLPDFLKRITNEIDDKRKRDMLLLSELIVLSSIFPEVKTEYVGDFISPNLFLFISAPAASGKSVIKYSKYTLNKILEEENDINRKKRNLFVEEQEKTKKKLVEPKYKRHMISPDSSYASLIERLDVNYGKGLIYTTEADALSKNNKSEWGNLNLALRHSFQNEEITLERLTKYINIQSPRQGVLISGTPSQLFRLIPDTEDGLFSRFMYYTFNKEIRILDELFTNGGKVDKMKVEYSTELKDIEEYYHNVSILIKGDKHNKTIQKNLQKLLDETTTFSGENFSDSIYRAGTIIAKIAMILTLLRNYKKMNFISRNDMSRILEISDTDIFVSFKIVETTIRHAQIIFGNINQNDEVVVNYGVKKEQFFDKIKIGKDFSTNSFYAKANEYGIKKTAAYNFLSLLLKHGKIEKISRGIYKKK